MPFDSQTHASIKRATMDARNGAARARRARWEGMFAYRLEALVPDAPDMARRFLVIDARHPGRRFPEMVSQLGKDAFWCGCQQALLGGGQDCDHISCVRSALARYGPPDEETPAERNTRVPYAEGGDDAP